MMDVLTESRMNERHTNHSPASPFAKKISWPAVLGGMVMALTMQILLGILGVGIGASTIDSLRQSDPLTPVGISAVAWSLVTTTVAFFIGGWVAGQLAGIPRHADSTMHGLLTWGSATLLSFYLLSSTAGDLVGGAASLARQGMLATGESAAVVADTAEETAAADETETDWADIRSEAEHLLAQASEEAAGDNPAAGAARTTNASNAQKTDLDLIAALDRLFTNLNSKPNAGDRQAVVNALVKQAGMPRPDAQVTVDRWIQSYQEMKVRSAQTARQPAGAPARGIFQGTMLVFFLLLAGGLAAAAGGYAAAPFDFTPYTYRVH